MEPTRRLTRRAVLTSTVAAAVAAPLAACTGSESSPAARPTRPSPAATTAPPEGDAALLATAVADEQALLAFLDDALRRAPRRLRRALAPQRGRQRAVVDALRGALTDPVLPAVQPQRAPAGAAAVVRELTRRLSAAEEARHGDCLTAESGPLARLLASVAASHAVAVEQVRRTA